MNHIGQKEKGEDLGELFGKKAEQDVKKCDSSKMGAGN